MIASRLFHVGYDAREIAGEILEMRGDPRPLTWVIIQPHVGEHNKLDTGVRAPSRADSLAGARRLPLF
jgi:hypothetical protein